MLKREQLESAIRYNLRKGLDGAGWRGEELAWPFSAVHVNTYEFAMMVYILQQERGLETDGKLGQETLSHMRVMHNKIPLRHSSNNVIVDGEKIGLPQFLLDVGASASNYIEDDDVHFRPLRGRQTPVYHVLHETVTNSKNGTVNALLSRKFKSGRTCGVHFILGVDGHISCHNDLVRESPIHANYLNTRAVGTELVNPYNPLYAKPPFVESIPAEWWTWVPKGGSRRYVLPTLAQMKVLPLLCQWISDIVPSIPLEFPTVGLNAKNPKIEGCRKYALPKHGHIAHRDFSTHADGRYLIEKSFEFFN